MSNGEEILEGAKIAFVDKDLQSYDGLKPKLIVNNDGNKVINSIKEELHRCEEFYISVAFITMGGITPLLQDFKELEAKNIKGKIITTNYLNFTEPAALKKLNEFENIGVKFCQEEGFHTKGYIFKDKNVYKGIIGSSNITLNALTINKEWNIGFSSLNNGEIIKNLFDEFKILWDESKDLIDIIDEYEKIYNENKRALETNKEILDDKIDGKNLTPNSMQIDFLNNIDDLISKGENKALLVSATGTGKTYASAFAVKKFNPDKFLFLVHREQIAKQAMKTFKKVFKDEDYKFGLLSGNSKQYDKYYLFSTIQTMSKDDVYSKFRRDEFDYIIIDEVHKAGAISYQKILNYFTPKFCLGMSASPERTDGYNIYELFDYNVALNIRLQDALEEDLLCPFHYFGITDLTVNGKVLDDNSDFQYLVSDDRINYILEQSEYYGYSGDRLKALVFCSTKKEAKELAKGFNNKGHPTVALTGENSQEEREDAIRRLTGDDVEDKLEYIITVDIFNEGVDIPEINQVLLVRPTQSSIIFIQQLGRGLRKFKNKEYVVIIDFIGNYKNNFLIPIALSGDKSYDKDIIRKYLMEGNKIIKGSSSISFDEISKKRIYNAINKATFKTALFKDKYLNLKYKLGRIPYLVDFYENGDLDPYLIISHNSFDSYYNFLKKYDKDYDEYLSDEEVKSLKFITDNFADGKRPHELLILKILSLNHYFTIELVEKALKDYNIFNDFKSIKHSFRMFILSFFKGGDKEKYSGINYFDFNDSDLDNLENLKDKKYDISDDFKRFLSSDVYKKHFNDLVDYALLRYKTRYNEQTEGENLKLFEKYSRKDVCRLLNWPENESSTIYGYSIKYDTCPIFVTYKKKEDISSSTKYEDAFESRDIFSWMTRSKVKLTSKESQEIINNQNLKIHLFINKSDDEGNSFYYMGQVDPIKDMWTETTIRNDKCKELPIVNFKLKLHTTVKEDLYNYFMDNIE